MAEKQNPEILSVPVFVIFLCCFTAALFFVNNYILSRFFLLAGREPGITLSILYPAFPAVLFVLATYLSRKHEGKMILFMYVAASYWLGYVVFVFPLLILSDIAALFLPALKHTFYLVSFITAFAETVYGSIKAVEIKVRTLDVPLGKGLTLVQVSDAHYGIINGDKALDKLVEKVNSLKPDIILFTGDLVDGTKVIHENTFLPLQKLSAPAYFVAGNHELFDGFDKVMPALKKGGVKVLNGGEAEEKGLRIIGLGYSFDKKHPGAFLDSLKMDSRHSIFMLHEPVEVERAAEKGISLMLSGHTHAGQIIPFNLLVRIPYQYMGGRYNVGKMVLNVSTGCGTWGPRMRLGSDCEINVIKI